MFYVVTLGPLVIEEFKRIIRESEVTKEDDNNWPLPDKGGCQELEIKIDREHIAFTVFCDYVKIMLSCDYLIFCVDKRHRKLDRC